MENRIACSCLGLPVGAKRRCARVGTTVVTTCEAYISSGILADSKSTHTKESESSSCLIGTTLLERIRHHTIIERIYHVEEERELHDGLHSQKGVKPEEVWTSCVAKNHERIMQIVHQNGVQRTR